jgi:hypothetical protein
MQPLCNLHGVGYVQSYARANSKAKGACSLGNIALYRQIGTLMKSHFLVTGK